MRILFVCKENKIQIITFFNNFFSSVSVSAVHSDENTRMCCSTVVNVHQILTQKRRNRWIKLFLFTLRTKYSLSFIKLRSNLWYHMDYFNDVLTTFLGLEYFSCVAVYGGLESFWISSNYLNLCSEDERRSYGFGKTWGYTWVFNDWIFGELSL